DEALKKILRGIGTLNSFELAGERMAVALESSDQEDEHPCFSDNTNADVVDDIKGIRMVYRGEFADVPVRACTTSSTMSIPSSPRSCAARWTPRWSRRRRFQRSSRR
ncbi:MAG: imelysin family protein, partial [Solirubrobacteraceae bacterium]